VTLYLSAECPDLAEAAACVAAECDATEDPATCGLAQELAEEVRSCKGFSPVVDIGVEGIKVYSRYDVTDHANPPAGNGERTAFRATELTFIALVNDGVLDLGFDLESSTDDPFLFAPFKAIAIQHLEEDAVDTNDAFSIPITQVSPSREYIWTDFMSPSDGAQGLIFETSDPNRNNAHVLYASWGEAPTPIRFDYISYDAHLPDSRLIVGELRREPLFLLVQGTLFDNNSNKGPAQAFLPPIAFTSSGPPSHIERVTPNCIGLGTESAHVTIDGFGFDIADTNFFLGEACVGPSECSNFPVLQKTIVSPTRAEVVFDTSDGAAGTYGVRSGPAETGVTFTIKETHKGALVNFDLRGYGAYRLNERSRMTLWYVNEGDRETTAPIFKIEGPTGTQFRLESDTEFRGNRIYVMGIDRGNAAGVLAPTGEEHTIPIFFKTPAPGSATFTVSIFDPTRDTEPIWGDTPPTGISPDLWQEPATRAVFITEFGNTWEEYRDSLATQATRLHRRGDDASSAKDLYRFLVRKTISPRHLAIVGRVVDSSTGAPLPGVVMVARTASTTVSSTFSDAGGHFSIDFLENFNSYDVRASGYTLSPSGDGISLPGQDVLNQQFELSGSPTTYAPECPNCDESFLPDSIHEPPPELFVGERKYHLEELRSVDPNDKLSSAGGNVCPGQKIEYTIRFENELIANSARVVTIIDDLDLEVFDIESFVLLDVKVLELFSYIPDRSGDGPITDEPSGVSTGFDFESDSLPDPIGIQFGSELELGSGRFEVTFETLNLDTRERPDNPNGFLAAGAGGFVVFSINVKDDLGPNTEVKNEGDITFDGVTKKTNPVMSSFSRCLPDVPRTPIPDNGQQSTSTTTTLSWRADNADFFDVLLSETALAGNPPGPPVIASQISESGVSPIPLRPATHYTWQVLASNQYGETPGPTWTFRTAGDVEFIRGDGNGTGVVDVTDPIDSLHYQFVGDFDPFCLDALDSDDSGIVDIVDPLRTLFFLFRGGVDIPAPGASACGVDPTLDDLDCLLPSCQ
jgi:hypothetical protein